METSKIVFIFWTFEIALLTISNWYKNGQNINLRYKEYFICLLTDANNIK